jgi:hypothetical protein
MPGTINQNSFWKVLTDPNIPIIENNEIPGTSYIDYYSLEDVSNNNVMKGRDFYGRDFIIIVVKVEGMDTPIMSTIFKRDNESRDTWMACGHATEKFIDTAGGMTNVQKNFVEDIIGGAEIEFHSGLKPGNLTWIGKKVRLWNY